MSEDDLTIMISITAADAFTALIRVAFNVSLSIKATASRKRRCIQFNGDDGDIIDINVDDPADNGMFSYSINFLHSFSTLTRMIAHTLHSFSNLTCMIAHTLHCFSTLIC